MTIYQVDLSSYASVLAAVKAIKNNEDEIDVLLLNGGILVQNRIMTEPDHHELMLQVNVLSNALLALSLLSLLQSTAVRKGVPSRLTWVSSNAQSSVATLNKPSSHPPPSKPLIPFLDEPANFDQFSRYGDSKLLVTMFVESFASKVPPEQVVVNSVCPGMVVSTELNRTLKPYLRPVIWVLQRVMGRSLEDGGRCYLHALGVVGRESHGQFIWHEQIHAYVLSFPIFQDLITHHSLFLRKAADSYHVVVRLSEANLKARYCRRSYGRRLWMSFMPSTQTFGTFN